MESHLERNLGDRCAGACQQGLGALNVSDAEGKPVMAENKYVHFSKDELPPVGAFWSLTFYDAEGTFRLSP